MKTLKNRFKAPIAAALGFGLAVAAGSASAGVTWDPDGSTLFEDDDVDFHFDAQGNAKTNGLLEIGDVLAAVLELNDSAGVAIQPEELTGLAIIQLVAREDVDGNGSLDDIFAPPAAGFDAYSGGAPALADGQGVAGAGGMVGFWLDGTPELEIDAGKVVSGDTSCLSYADCVTQATDGDQWLVAGFSGDADEFWIVRNAPDDVTAVTPSDPSFGFGNLNTGLGALYNGTGRQIVFNNQVCTPFCAPGGDQLVDILAGGSIKGGGINPNQSPDGEWFATSDFDMTLQVPVPGTVLLMGLGLLGLTTTARRKKA